LRHSKDMRAQAFVPAYFGSGVSESYGAGLNLGVEVYGVSMSQGHRRVGGIRAGHLR